MGGNFIGATGLDENQEQFDILKDEIDANASYINNLVGIPDPVHLSLFGINPLNPGLYGLVERAEVNISALQSGEEGLGTDLSALTTQVEGIQGEITGIQGEITTIQGEITGIEGSISTIQFVELPAIGTTIAGVAGVAGDALGKANKSLGIWDEDANNTYNMKTGNVGIGILPKGTILNNKLEVNGNINIPTGSTFRINNVPLSYSDLAGTPPVSSKWTNATDVATNIYYSTGNVGIGITTAINNKLEVGGNLNISAGSKYKINNVNLAFSDLGGTLSYNSLTDRLTAGTNISIVGNAINNTYTYTLPTAGVGSGGTLGGVKVDNSTITINNGVISAAAATPQVNSDWTQTNDNLKSFIQNKPTAGNNISFANNTITNTITGSTTQNIIGLNTNQLIVVDKPNSEKIDEAFIPLTNEPYSTPSVVPTTEGNPITHKTLTYTFNQGNIVAYYKFNGDYTDSNPSSTKYNLSATGTLDFQTTRFIEGQSVLFNANNEFLSTAVNFPNQFGMSYSFWFLLDDITANRIVFAIGQDFFIMLQPQVSKIYISNTMAGNETYTTPSFTFSTNTWYHLVLIFLLNGTWKLYMNGVDLNINGLNGTYPLTAAKIPTGKLFIGGKNIGYWVDTFYRGNVDEFFAFNKEISQTEITSLYNKTFSIPINQYTLSVPLSGTGVIINNTPLQYISAGTYTISVGATQSSVVIAGIGQVGSDPYPLQNGSTIAFKYSMTQKIQAITYYKKDGLIKYVPASGTNPSTGTWQMIDVDSQALTQFAGNLPFTRIDGNLPASKLDPIDMSKVSTGQLPISRTDGNLPASRLDAIDMSKVSTGNLYYNRITDSHLLVNERFHRIIYAYENVVDTMGVWTNKFKVNTNLHLNYYNQAYNYFQYYLSLSPNNVVDRHKYWFGVVKMSTLVGTDPTPLTSSYFIDTSANSSFLIKPTTSTDGVWWLNIWILTSAYCESMLCTLH